MKWILGLSRYPVFQPQNTPNTRKRILSPIMPCFRGFGVFRGSLIFGDKSQYMVAAPSSRVGRGESEGKSRVRLIVFSPDVANCRQTVDALLAPLPPLGSGWLRFGSRRFAIPGRSHLSPDGGGFTRAAPPLGSGWLRFDSRRFNFPGRSHLSPDGGSFTRHASPLGSEWLR
jgi:hypothetical protein